jgi:hypothetical protein
MHHSAPWTVAYQTFPCEARHMPTRPHRPIEVVLHFSPLEHRNLRQWSAFYERSVESALRYAVRDILDGDYAKAQIRARTRDGRVSVELGAL